MSDTASAAPRVPKRVAAVILNSLKGGVVPRIGLPYITVGREVEIRALLTDLSLIADGGASFRFLVGRYGAGKSFLLQTIRTHAMGEGFVVADADLSPERRLQGGQGQGLATYRELIRNISTKTRPEGGALNLILDRWVASCADADESAVNAQLAPLEEMVHGFDFTRMLHRYRAAVSEGDEEAMSRVTKWIRGEYRTKSEARAELGSSTIISDDDWYDYVKLIARFLVCSGYKGTLVLIDELVNLYKIPNAITRQYNYEKILTMYNDTLQGKAQYLGMIMGGTPTSIEDRRRGVFSYEALRSRLAQGRFAREDLKDMLAPIIRLQPLTYEELLVLQLGIGRMKNRGSASTGAPMQRLDPAPFWASLPFSPTGAQRRAVDEILTDLSGSTSMNRLLQGDVGSGKTLVAAAAIWACIRSGYQAALLAPTEILAAQHAENLNRMLAPFGMRVALLTGGMKAAARRTTLAAIRSDEADLVVGTHAILSEGVEFARLGLAVVDEQHRFGVRQRGMLAEKAANPHLLVMSATPIPRTLGLLIYGDLDISILDELPPGRKPVKTRCITGKKRRDLYGFLDREIGAGRQVYIVCPAIEDTPDGGLNAVKSYYEDIAKALLPDRRVGLMHGKLKPKEKAAVMDDFKAGRLDALVSTTVIEVGVDVLNATVMVIENAERYGLSALHQLRGRVGRGAAESWCFLVSDNTAESVQKRLKFLCSTSDGFAVAQFDLETRGPGDFFGSRQHGLPTLQIADLMNDTRTLHAAQAEAAALLAADPLLEATEHSLLAAQVEQMFTKAGAMN